MKVWDSFLPSFHTWNAHARSRDYSGAVNPEDGVRYPDVTSDVHPAVLNFSMTRIGNYLGKEVSCDLPFMRLTSSETETAPHQAHHDAIQGEYTFILYFQDGEGGTDFVTHVDEGDDVSVETWQRDTNVYDKWEVTGGVEMKANRAVLFPSAQMHRAEPVNGLGDGVIDGRIVLTLFVNTHD